MRNFTLTALNMGYNSGILTAMAKCCITELSRKMTNIVMDIYSVRANMLGPNNFLAKIYQSIPMNMAINGTNNFLKQSMIFQSGVIINHPFLAAEIGSLETNNIEMFDQHCFSHISYMLSNFAKMVLHNFSNKIFCFHGSNLEINKDFKKHCRHLSFFSYVLSCLVELSIFQYGVLLKR